MPGFKKQPTAIVKAKGYYRADRYPDEAVENGVVFLTTVPEPPLRLKGEGVNFWNSILGEAIHISGYIAVQDIFIFEQLCYTFQTMTSAQSDIELFGNTEIDQNGNRRPSAGYRIYKESLKDFITLCREFGLSPSSRGNIKFTAKGEGKKDLKEQFKL